MTPMALYVDSFNDVLEGGRKLRLIISADMIKLDMMGGRQMCADTFGLRRLQVNTRLQTCSFT